MNFTDREREIATLLREDPETTQAEIARALGISRQAVSAHIRKMVEKFDRALVGKDG